MSLKGCLARIVPEESGTGNEDKMRILVVANLYPTPHSPTSGTFVKQSLEGLRRVGVNVDLVFVDRVGKGRTAYIGLRRAVQKRVADFRPHLVHVMYGGLQAAVVTRIVTDRPVVVSFFGSDLLGGAFYNPFRRLTVHLGVRASSLAAKRAAGVIVRSREMQSALPRTVDPSKVWVIPEGVDMDRFRPLNRADCRKSLAWSENSYHVLTPAHRGRPVKRLELAQSAVERLKHESKSVILHQLVEVPYAEVPVWLNASDVLLLTSYHEGSPNIVKQALACNRPVVSVDVGDVRERIEGVDGCHLARPEAEDLAEKLRLVLAGGGVVEGRARVQELSIERVASRLRDVYTTVLARSRPG